MAHEQARSPGRPSLGPLHMLLIGFASAIAAGAVLLSLPVSTNGRPLPLIDALFTATSAVCVTGLTVVDTGTRFTTFGHVVIICLIQAGGLGIMTFSTLAFLAMGERPGMRQKEILRDGLVIDGPVSPKRVALEVVLTAFLLEAVGAAILYWPMSEKAPAGAVGSACFHSISAFCNAGSSLYPDSLTQFRPVWSLNLTIAALIILGGVGFPVVRHLRRIVVERVRGHRLRVKLHTKIALITTAILLAAGMLAFFLFEGAGQMSGSPLGERLLASFFQSVTTRTAGFNTIDFARAHDGSLFVSCILMFIGGSPASAAGGVKTTTVAVLIIVGVSMIRQRDKPDVMGRAVPREAIRRAMVLVMVEAILIACAVTALLATEGSLPWPSGKGPLTCVMFEVLSAFGTVGLSTGITPSLSIAGKAVIMLAMFLGRVGPLTLVRSIAPGARRAEYEYPEENVMVG